MKSAIKLKKFEPVINIYKQNLMIYKIMESSTTNAAYQSRIIYIYKERKEK